MFLFSKYLEEFTKQEGLNIKTVSLHPGVIYTEIARDLHQFMILKALLAVVYPVFFG